MASFTDAQKRIGELDREVTHWVKSQGDTQALADRLQAELDEVRTKLAAVTSTATEQSLPVCEDRPDFEGLTEKALASLKLGKQAPGYKAAVKAIAKFRELLQGG